MRRISRRDFTIQTAFGAGAALALSPSLRALAAADPNADVLHAPDAVSIEFDDAVEQASRHGTTWGARDASVETHGAADGLQIRLHAPKSGVKRIRLTWNIATPASALVLNDAWERGYGDLSWQGPDEHRILPWYVVVADNTRAHGFGVKTQPAAMCSWRVSADATDLICDVRSGPRAVRLGGRTLDVATIVALAGNAGESAFRVASRLCHAMCVAPRLPDHNIYGSNDWYVNYGNNSRDQTVRDAAILADLTSGIANRPYAVVDGGWQETGGAGGGPWDRPAAKFGDMSTLAATMRTEGVRPGIWLRLLSTKEALPETHFRPSSTRLLDPSVPEVLDLITRAVRRATGEWGYDLIKHDYSSEDVFGRWGNQMGEAMYSPMTHRPFATNPGRRRRS